MPTNDQAWTVIPAEWREACRQLPSHLIERIRPIAPNFREAGRATRNRDAKRSALGPVVYWTHHALRVDENPALDVAVALARATDRPMVVYRGLSATYRYASDRHHAFQLQSTRELERAYEALGVRFVVALETVSNACTALLRMAEWSGVLVTDDFPGEPTERWLQRLSRLPQVTLLAVDTACVVPMQLAGHAYDRAFAFRDAIQPWLKERLEKRWPAMVDVPKFWEGEVPFEPTVLSQRSDSEWIARCGIDHSIAPVADTRGGSQPGYARWAAFVQNGLRSYAAKRNDPCSGVASRMSAYLHYGMVSPMRLAREAAAKGADKYIDELVIWRELAYGYCFYRSDYMRLDTLPKWAVASLAAHERDRREWLYSWETLSRGRTHDRLWNACQDSLLRHGEMHNNVRMTWGKSLLAWTRDAAEALRWLIDLNHRYALDGRDPASYGGILWCLGQFDRPFEPEQPVLGRVRGRTTEEHTRRLDVSRYEAWVRRPISQRRARVAVIGAGIAGLMCARILSDHGIEVEIFEKSRGPGGRAATRRLESGGLVDHGPPYALIRGARWQPMLEAWEQDGVLARWEGRIVRWDGRVATELRDGVRWIGARGMNGLGKHLAEGVRLHLQSRVARVFTRADGQHEIDVRNLSAISENAQGSTASSVSSGADDAQGTLNTHGPYDVVLWNCPPAQVMPMVPQECGWRAYLEGVTMKPCWAMLFSLASRWEMPWDGAWVQDPIIAWIGRESSKPGRGAGLDDWVVHATAEWTRDHLDLAPEVVQQALWRRLVELSPVELSEPVTHRMHRWMYSTTDIEGNRVFGDGLGYGWDETLRMGVCGDWCASPHGLEGALNSGQAMAGGVLRWLVDQGPATIEAEESRMKQLDLF